MSSRRGEINGWTCDYCGQTTYCVHVDDGVTPMFLACRAEGVEPNEAKCKGMGRSLMYPPAPPPPHVLAAVRWEWYEPDRFERARLDPISGELEHVEKGGLLLRSLTDAGRELIGGTDGR
jgi:hypothetical protein